MTEQTDLVVIGGGPGGYTAAIRAGQLGVKTILVEAESILGGTCLREGCIPSKALLHAAEVIELTNEASSFGLQFTKPQIDINKLRSWKDGIISKLGQGVSGLCKSNQVQVIKGQARFLNDQTLFVNREEGAMQIKFKHAIIATGSSIIKIPSLFKTPKDAESKRALDSRSALQLPEIPKTLLVVGGGYIGLELGTVYAALGGTVTVVEMTDGLLPGVDRDLVKPLANHLASTFKNIFLRSKVSNIEEIGDAMSCQITTEDGKTNTEKFDYVLVSVGRKPNTADLALETTMIQVDKPGFIKVDEYCRTSNKRILAIGDASGQPMLAHRAMRQGTVAAEVIAGLPSAFDNITIPAVVYTEPEIAWCGITETEAKAKDIKIDIAKFPWSASSRAMTLANTTGLTKIIYDPETMLIKGMGIVGPRAGDLITEGVLAMEAGLVLDDLARTIHPHPGLAETISEAATAAIHRKARRARSS